MLRSYKVQLNISSEKVRESFKRMAGIYRLFYNLGTNLQQTRIIEFVRSPKEQFMNGTQLLSYSKSLEKKFFKSFTKEVDSGIISAATFASSKAFLSTFDYHVDSLHFLSRKKDRMKFKTNGNIRIYEDHITIPKLGDVRLCEKGRIPVGKKYSNITFSHDGFNWFISLDVDETIEATNNSGKSLYIYIDNDNSLIVNGLNLGNITNSLNYTKIEKKYKKELKKLRRQKRLNRTRLNKPTITKNIQKTKKRIDKITNKLYNIRKDYFAKVAHGMAITKPEELHVPAVTSTRESMGINACGQIKGSLLEETRKYQKSSRHFLNVIMKKLELTGTRVIRHLSPEEFREPGAQVCVEGNGSALLREARIAA